MVSRQSITRLPDYPITDSSLRAALRSARAGTREAPADSWPASRPGARPPAAIASVPGSPGCSPNRSVVAVRAATTAMTRPVATPAASRIAASRMHHPDHVRAIRAERHADPDLVLPARHHVRHDAVEADGGEQRGEAAEEPRQRRHQPLPQQRIAHLRFHRLELRDDRRAERGHRRRHLGRDRRERRGRPQHDLQDGVGLVILRRRPEDAAA